MKHIITFILFFTLSCSIQAETREKENWCIQTTSRENYNGVTLANGRIGLVSYNDLFSVKEIILNGVYDKEYEDGVSRIVRAPNFTNLSLKINRVEVNLSTIKDWRQMLDMKEAYLQTTFNHDGTEISYTLRALRNLPYMT